MPEQIRTGAECNGTRRWFAWIRLQDDDDRPISIGFADSGFVVRGLTSEREVDGIRVAEYVDLESDHPIASRQNPHFTLHGHYLHVRGNSGRHLFEGLTFRVVRHGETSTPLLRLVSKPFEQLPEYRPTRVREPLQVIGVRVPTVDFAVALQFDLASASAASREDVQRLDHFITWGGIVLRLQAWAVRGQDDAIVVFS